MKRGKFIVLEGLDRSGKSSVASSIKEYLEKTRGETTIAINYPNRQTDIGILISSYLKNNTQLSDQAIHLLFSANRWEKNSYLQETLDSGVNIVCDRYWFSGVAYSCAKGLDYEWCIGPDRGLLQPNLVIFLDADPDLLKTRPGYGQQKYQRVQLQKKTQAAFHRIFKTQSTINVKLVEVGNRTMEEVQVEARNLIEKWLN